MHITGAVPCNRIGDVRQYTRLVHERDEGAAQRMEAGTAGIDLSYGTALERRRNFTRYPCSRFLLEEFSAFMRGFRPTYHDGFRFTHQRHHQFPHSSRFHLVRNDVEFVPVRRQLGKFELDNVRQP